jgi:beta-D-xylosidase 4
MLQKTLTLQALVAGALSSHLFPDCQAGPLANNTVCDTTASIAARAGALVAALTNEEKFNLTGNTSPGVPRLGLPSYQWWRESISTICGSSSLTFGQRRHYMV